MMPAIRAESRTPGIPQRIAQEFLMASNAIRISPLDQGEEFDKYGTSPAWKEQEGAIFAR